MAYAFDCLNGAHSDACLMFLACIRIDHESLESLDNGLRRAFGNARRTANAVAVDLKSHALSVSQT